MRSSCSERAASVPRRRRRARRDFVERLVLADVRRGAGQAAAERTGDARFSGIALDASDAAAIAAPARAEAPTRS